MALTKDQWYSKLKSWVPTWFFEGEYFNRAQFEGIAKLLSEAQQQAEDHQSETFLAQAADTFLDVHGNERSFERLPRETDAAWALRIRSLLNTSNKLALQVLVNQFLIVGVCTILEHSIGESIFCNRGSYLNRREVFSDSWYNTFSVLIDPQIHDGYSFYSRGNFCNRGDFVSDDKSSKEIFDLVAQILNNHKAAGTLYRLIER